VSCLLLLLRLGSMVLSPRLPCGNVMFACIAFSSCYDLGLSHCLLLHRNETPIAQHQRQHITPPASISTQYPHLSTTSPSPPAHRQPPNRPAVSAELPALPALPSSSASATAPTHPSAPQPRSSSPVSQPVRVLSGGPCQTAAVRGRRGGQASVAVVRRGQGSRARVLAGLGAC